MSKKFGIKALAMVASLGMTAVLVGGCNPADEPALKPTVTPAPAVKPKTDDKGTTPAPAPAPVKKDEKK